MATTIKLKSGSGAPLAGDLVAAEPAFDLTNKRLYTEDSGGTVIEVGTNPSTIDINAGTIDGTVIGGSSAAAGTFTTFTSTGIDDNATSTAITIDSSDNVGIGTASPSGFDTNTLVVESSDGVGTSSGITISNSFGAGSASLRFATTATFDSKAAVVCDVGANSLSFETNGQNKRMTIASSGNVGIGTTNPSPGTGSGLALHLQQNSNTPELRLERTGTFVGDYSLSVGGDNSNRLRFVNNDSGATEMVLLNGNVGIGTTSPSETLEVNGDGRFYKQAGGTTSLTLTASGSNSTELTFGSFGAADNVGKIIGDSASLAMAFNVNASERMRIDASGNVGINATVPSAFNQVTGQGRLVVGGGAADEGMTIYSSASNSGSIAFADGASGTAQWRGVVQYVHSDDSMRFFTTNTLRMTINSSGNVGIGTTSPDSILHLSGSSASKIIIEDSASPRGNYIGINSSDNLVIAADEDNLGTSSNIQFRVDATERMRIDSSGNVGIGTASSSPTALLSVGWSTSGTLASFKSTGASGKEAIIYADGAGAIFGRGDGSAGLGNDYLYMFDNMQFVVNGSERMRIDSSGNVGIGTASPSYTLHVSGTTYLDNTKSTPYNSSSEATLGVFGTLLDTSVNSGAVYNIEWKMYGSATGQYWYANYITRGGSRTLGAYCTGTTWTNSSDIANKENIESTKYGLSTVLATNPVDFNWKTQKDEDGNGKPDVGFIAQEMELVIPEVVTGVEGSKGISYGNLVAIAFKAIQEQQAMIEDLKAEVAALKGA
jgi:hypothetical protein